MSEIAWIMAGVLAVLFVVQAIPTLGFVRALGREKYKRLADEDCPGAAVILCLRGDDPFLRQCLEGLLTQDYPRYDVRVVVDQREDPAWNVVEATVARLKATNIVVEPLLERLETCSLKGSSIVQAVSSLDDDYDVVAFLDSDTLPHPTWLRELAAPLTDERYGASSGNRWYMPAQPTWGALVRYTWNAAAVVQMYWNRFTWGGSVALRGDIARHPDLLDSWRTAISTDTVILAVVRQQGRETAFVPSLMMTNRESCDLPGFYGWVQRQIIVARLYHRGWLPILIHGALMTLVPAAAIVLIVAGLAGGRTEEAVWLLAAAIGYWIAMGLLLAFLEWGVRRVVRARGEPTGWLSGLGACKGFLALPLTQLIYAITLVKANFMRTVSWRGVSYRIAGPRRVRMVEYQPYQSSDRTAGCAESL